jgi:hypothetical protein
MRETNGGQKRPIHLDRFFGRFNILACRHSSSFSLILNYDNLDFSSLLLASFESYLHHMFAVPFAKPINSRERCKLGKGSVIPVPNALKWDTC